MDETITKEELKQYLNTYFAGMAKIAKEELLESIDYYFEEKRKEYLEKRIEELKQENEILRQQFNRIIFPPLPPSLTPPFEVT